MSLVSLYELFSDFVSASNTGSLINSLSQGKTFNSFASSTFLLFHHLLVAA